METIGEIAAGRGGRGEGGGEDRGLLALLLETRGALQVRGGHPPGPPGLQENPDCLKDAGVRKEIEASLSEIVEKGRGYAEKGMTRDERREKILQICEELKELVNEKFKSIETDMSKMQATVKELTAKIRKLQRLLRKTVVDQVSDLFINSLNPINSMLAYAQKGRKQASFCLVPSGQDKQH